MKSIFFPAVMLCGVALSTIHPSHANDLDEMMVDQEDAEINHMLDHREEMCAITHSSQWCDAPAPVYRAPRKEWADLTGRKHDCVYDPPLPVLGAMFGAKC
jgi:hypothetical protein